MGGRAASIWDVARLTAKDKEMEEPLNGFWSPTISFIGQSKTHGQAVSQQGKGL